MNKRASLEMIAPTVEEAVARGLEELGMSEEEVEVEVLDAGSRGLFGLGSRQARVRLTIRAEAGEGEASLLPAPEEEAELPAATPAPVSAPAAVELPKEAAKEAAVETAKPVRKKESAVELGIARDTVHELLEKMGVAARVEAHYAEAENSHGHTPIWVDVNGDDLSILIGPRAETLNALQYIASLIVSNELGGQVSLIVDVEGFRARRTHQIRMLARRMADQAVKTGRRQVLEPMPAAERRLVHIELRSNPLVTTESVGEEPRRKVTIIPTKPA
jgi:spoIIIJ-associated protein